MALLSDAELNELKIQRFIFHIVGVESDEPPGYLKEIDLKNFELETFFLRLMKMTLKGNTYQFVEDSTTWKHLRSILRAPQQFEPQSRELAADFHKLHTGQTIPGLFFLAELRTGTSRLFSIIKYDRQEVVEFDIKLLEGDSANEVVLRLIDNTIVQNPEALQKSALIQMTDDVPQIVLIDRKNPKNPAEYFRKFLGVSRTQSEEAMTKSLMHIATKIAIGHSDDLPDEIVVNIKRRCYDYIKTQTTFEEDQFLASICGPVAQDSPIRETYSYWLDKEKLKDQIFEPTIDAVKEPKKIRLRTNEDVLIIYNEGSRGEKSIQVTPQADGSKQIMITTTRLVPE